MDTVETIKIQKHTFDLFFLQDEAHHLLPEPSITPCPWKRTPFNLENSSHARENFGSQLLGSSGATIVPSICESIVPFTNMNIVLHCKEYKEMEYEELSLMMINEMDYKELSLQNRSKKGRCSFRREHCITDYLDD